MNIKNIYKNKENKTVLTNIFSLSLLNGINFIFPLLIIPYLVRVIGLEKYGAYNYAFVIIQYLILIVNYGFQFSATKSIAQNRSSLRKISQIFSSITIIRIVAAILSIIIIFLLVSFIPKLKEIKQLLLFGSGILLGTSINPIWLFQGMEKMKYLTLINFVLRSAFLVLIILFIKGPEDYIYITLLHSVGYLLSGAVSMVLAFRLFKISFILPKFTDLVIQIKTGWNLFVSTISMNFYRNLNPIILGIFAGYESIGYYSAAEKIIKALQALINPVSQALFPFFSRKMSSSNSLSTFLKFSKVFSIFLLLVSIFLFFGAELLIRIYLGDEFSRTILNLKILSIIIFFGGLNYYLGIIGLVNLGFEKKFTLYVLVTGFFSLATSFILSYYFIDIGASIAMSISEILLFSLIVIKLLKIKNERK